jgi:drug/metabolite transporter (DMT)-like permease
VSNAGAVLEKSGEAIRAPSRLAIPAALLSVAIWGSYYPIIEHLLGSWDAVTLSWARNVMAAGALGVLLVVTEGVRSLFRDVPWRPVWSIGIIGVAANILLSSYAVQYAGAVPAALITGGTPVLAALMAWLFYGQRPGWLAWFSIALAVTGVTIVTLGGSGWDGSFMGGEFMVLAAALTWVWYMIMIQKALPGFSQLRATAITMITGAFASTAGYGAVLVLGYGPVAYDASVPSLAFVFFSAAGSVALGTVLWNFAVSRLGVTVTSLFGNLVPVVAVALSLAWGGTIGGLQVVGGVLVLIAVIIMQVGPRLAARARRR